jgi:hypothetical protein
VVEPTLPLLLVPVEPGDPSDAAGLLVGPERIEVVRRRGGSGPSAHRSTLAHSARGRPEELADLGWISARAQLVLQDAAARGADAQYLVLGFAGVDGLVETWVLVGREDVVERAYAELGPEAEGRGLASAPDVVTTPGPARELRLIGIGAAVLGAALLIGLVVGLLYLAGVLGSDDNGKVITVLTVPQVPASPISPVEAARALADHDVLRAGVRPAGRPTRVAQTVRFQADDAGREVTMVVHPSPQAAEADQGTGDLRVENVTITPGERTPGVIALEQALRNP